MRIGGALMPLKIDIQTNYSEQNLTIESCSEIIELLQLTYSNIRKELYNYFLDIKHLKKAIFICLIPALLYLISQNHIFIYFIPISLLCILLLSIISAEYLTSLTRKQIKKQIQHLKETRDKLIRMQKLKV